MKKILRYLVMSLMAFCFTVPALGSAEAASVALLPLINNVQGDELVSQIFFKQAIGTLNSTPGFFIVETDRLAAAIDAARIGNKVPDKAALAKIARDGDVDIVIAMQIDKLEDFSVRSSAEDTVHLVLKGFAVSYNRLNGKFYNHKVFDDTNVPEATTARWDFVHEQFARNVRIELNRIINAK